MIKSERHGMNKRAFSKTIIRIQKSCGKELIWNFKWWKCPFNIGMRWMRNILDLHNGWSLRMIDRGRRCSWSTDDSCSLLVDQDVDIQHFLHNHHGCCCNLRRIRIRGSVIDLVRMMIGHSSLHHIAGSLHHNGDIRDLRHKCESRHGSSFRHGCYHGHIGRIAAYCCPYGCWP